MHINNVSVNTRFNRPSVLDKTALVIYFINDGKYADPYEISGVSIFAANSNFYPSSVVNSDGEIDNSVSSLVLMHFAPSTALTTDSGFDTSNYPGVGSGVFRISEGVYVAVLDSDVTESVFNLSGENLISNRVSAIGDYIDVWTIRRKAGSDLDAIINEFTLTEDRFFAVTEPILFRVASRLENNNITLGSKVDLKITNEFTIENSSIDRSIVNLFKQSLAVNPRLQIYKKNDDRNLPARVTVSSFDQTSGTALVTSENTVIWTFDTRTLSTHPELLSGNLGAQTGIYALVLEFEALNQIYRTNELAFIIR